MHLHHARYQMLMLVRRVTVFGRNGTLPPTGLFPLEDVHPNAKNSPGVRIATQSWLISIRPPICRQCS